MSRSFEVAINKDTGLPMYENARIPEYATAGSAGADFFCAEEVVIPSIWRNLFNLFKSGFSSDEDDGTHKLFQPTFIHTGIKSNMYQDEVLYLYNRSSNPKKLGLVLANSVGVVDSDYYGNESNDGEIMFAFYNFMPWDVKIKVGDRIGQGVFQKFLRPESGRIVKTDVRTGGYGSTGSR